jgi:hypothetical protein
LQEDFERLQSLSKNIPAGSLDAFRLLKDAFNDDNVSLREALNNFSSAEKKALYLLQKLLYQFQHGKPYGLDTHLSLRIRHGSFTGYLRSVFEANAMISMIDSTTKKYQIPTQWISAVNEMQPNERSLVETAFAKFSKNVDAELNRTVQELIQIRSASKPEGFIDISVSLLTVKVIATSETTMITLRNFVDFCFLLFLASLYYSIKAIRNYLH